MLRGRLVAVALGLLSAGCHHVFDAEGTLCDSKGACPEGFVCAQDARCHLPVGGGGGRDDGGADAAVGGGAGFDGGPATCPDCTQPGCEGRVCRPASGVCDAPELCALGACPSLEARVRAGEPCAGASCTGPSTSSPFSSCDGTGQCVALLGQPCASGYACAADAGTCSTSCTSGAGCTPDSFCAGTTCQPRQGIGRSCTLPEQCLSGLCRHGFCCDSDCGGECEACDLTQTTRGTCTPRAARVDGGPVCAGFLCDGLNGACPATCLTNADCEGGRFCDEMSRCVALKPRGASCARAQECVSTFCVDSICCESACGGGCDSCDNQSGSCMALPKGAPGRSPVCEPFLCAGDAGSCPSACMVNDDCSPDGGCVMGVCQGKFGLGQSCLDGGAAACASNFCADGTCCNAPCAGGSCDRCDLPGTVGACTINVGASDAGCGPYRCAPSMATCPGSCTADTQCLSGHYCTASDGGTGACAPVRLPGSTCFATGGDRSCSTGFCRDGKCCNELCSGSCQVCSAAMGASADGTCTVVPVGMDPRNACGAYTCNGSSGSCPGGCASACATAQCKSGAFCNGALCTDLLDAGVACPQGCGCSAGVVCSSYFEDFDRDTFGRAGATFSFCGAAPSAGYVRDAGDCSDTEAIVFPGQPLFFDTARAGDGGFDYDCSGAVEGADAGTGGQPCPAVVNTVCNETCVSFEGVVGWNGPSPPACGAMGTYYLGTCRTASIYGAGCLPEPPGKIECDQQVDYQRVQTCH